MYPEQYIHFLVHFHGTRDYFECHEIFEEYWKETDNGNKQSILVAFILLAVSCYHHRRNNFAGAEKCLQKSIKIFQLNRKRFIEYGLQPEQFEQLLSSKLKAITEQQKYHSFQLPIVDERLIEQCKELSAKYNVQWPQDSDMGNLEIIHRHITRDRTEVIDARKEALIRKKRRE